MINKKKHISFFANKEEVLLLEKLKFINLTLNGDNRIKEVIMQAIREHIIKLENENNNNYDKNQLGIFDKAQNKTLN